MGMACMPPCGPPMGPAPPCIIGQTLDMWPTWWHWKHTMLGQCFIMWPIRPQWRHLTKFPPPA